MFGIHYLYTLVFAAIGCVLGIIAIHILPPVALHYFWIAVFLIMAYLVVALIRNHVFYNGVATGAFYQLILTIGFLMNFPMMQSPMVQNGFNSIFGTHLTGANFWESFFAVVISMVVYGLFCGVLAFLIAKVIRK